MHNVNAVRLFSMGAIFVSVILVMLVDRTLTAQSDRSLTPAQLRIEQQQQRLSAADPEERRDAVMILGSMHLPAASRAALPALTDPSPMVRAVGAKAILALGPNASVEALIPLLSDKNEFVRCETTYALGLTHSANATSAVSERLLSDKADSVRGAAAVALGGLKDEGAVSLLASILAPELVSPQKGKRGPERNPLVLRAAATSLGLIGSRAGTPALIAALGNERYPNDVRREAARSLGLIGDPAATPALTIASKNGDSFLSQIAFQSLKKISP
jgi:HEAT repeat protein